jgi:predicted dehydrogenase
VITFFSLPKPAKINIQEYFILGYNSLKRINMQKVRLGIIGCGLAAKELHLPALKRLNNKFEITALANHTEPKAKELSEILGGVPYMLDYHDLLKRDDVDAVDIALPIDLNYQAAKDALDHGKHVILEKPIAGTLEEAREMLSFPSKYDKVMMIAENFRYRNVYKKVKEIIKNGTIGEAYAANWNLYYYVPVESKYAQTEWRQKHKYPGGFMNDAGVHNVAALRLIFGEILSANALTKSVNPAIGVPDTMSMQFVTERGVIGVYNIFFTVNGHWEDKLLIFGDKGTIEVNTNKITIKQNNQENVEIDTGEDHGYYEEFDDFYNAIINGTKVYSTFDEGFKDLQVVLNALASAGERKMVVF